MGIPNDRGLPCLEGFVGQVKLVRRWWCHWDVDAPTNPHATASTTTTTSTTNPDSDPTADSKTSSCCCCYCLWQHNVEGEEKKAKKGTGFLHWDERMPSGLSLICCLVRLWECACCRIEGKRAGALGFTAIECTLFLLLILSNHFFHLFSFFHFSLVIKCRELSVH